MNIPRQHTDPYGITSRPPITDTPPPPPPGPSGVSAASDDPPPRPRIDHVRDYRDLPLDRPHPTIEFTADDLAAFNLVLRRTRRLTTAASEAARTLRRLQAPATRVTNAVRDLNAALRALSDRLPALDTDSTDDDQQDLPTDDEHEDQDDEQPDPDDDPANWYDPDELPTHHRDTTHK